ncbi:MAG TPA: pyruvate kinase, partial [Thermoleophilaceae bacterium]|nr:pyruvate kinase [Thermoleophilaceae bacterium]
GLDVARLNFAHGTFEQMAQTAERVREASDRAGRNVAILQDLPGPKLRIGPVRDDLAELAVGDTLTLVCGSDEEGDHARLSVTWAGLCEAVQPDEVVYLSDGSVRLRVKAIRGQEIETRVEVGGGVTSRQGLNVPGELSALPAVAEDDLERLRFGETIGVDMVALSFVRRPDEITALREHTDSPLVAKIEKPQAVDNLDAIAHAADCLMVARGDLGIEMDIERVPLVQKQIIRKAGELARPVITATQMLDSMVVSSRPTRAEVADVANAIMDGTDAVMLSQETAVGAHPVAAVKMMDAIARTTEHELPLEHWNHHRVLRQERAEQDPAYTVAYNACDAAMQLDLAALVVPTLSGRSARIISAHRPRVPIYVLSPDPGVVRRASLMWGVQAESMEPHGVTEELIADASRRVVELGWVKFGERIGITAGLPSGQPGTTSLFQIQAAG